MTLEIFNSIAILISIAGSIIIVWGVLVTIFSFTLAELAHLKGVDSLKKRQLARFSFGTYLLLGLDFMLAADIIHTIHNPALNELYVLGLIVVIRSVISYFLIREMQEVHE